MGGYLFGAVIPNKNMQKTTQAMLGILLMITMSLSMGFGGMSVNDENVNHTSARGDTNCTSDEGCPDGYTCSSDGVCVAEETCDVDGDCPDGETCEDGTCENTVPESSCEDTNQETNEDGTCGVCLDGYGLDANGDCVEDPSLDNSCTSDADCADGQICGAAGECMDAPDDSGNETNGNETNDGGDEPQYRNCTYNRLAEFVADGMLICDDETGEWVELEDTRPTSVEIGCDEEPTEEQLDASNFADLLNEHDEILIRDGDDTIRMRTMNGSQALVSWGDARGGVFSTGGNITWNNWTGFGLREITPQSQVFLIDIENNHSRTEMVVITEDSGTEGRSNSSDFDYHDCNQCWRLSVSLNGSSVFIGSGLSAANGSAPWYGLEVWQTKGEIGGASFNLAADIDLSMNVHGGDKISMNNSNVFFGLSVYDGGLEGMTPSWAGVIADGDNDSWLIDVGCCVGSKDHNNSPVVEGERIFVRVSNGINDIYTEDEPIYMRHGKGIQIGMDENGTVTNANIVRSNTDVCIWVEDIDGENKDDGNEPEDESSNVLVAAGGVEVTTRDAAVAGVAAVTTALLSAVIRRGGDASASMSTIKIDSDR